MTDKPKEAHGPDKRLQRGALISLNGRLLEVVRREVSGMRPDKLICIDCLTDEVMDCAAAEVKDRGKLERAAEDGEPVADAVPMSTECLIADARATRLAA